MVLKKSDHWAEVVKPVTPGTQISLIRYKGAPDISLEIPYFHETLVLSLMSSSFKAFKISFVDIPVAWFVKPAIFSCTVGKSQLG